MSRKATLALAAVVLLGALAYLFYPLRTTVKGMGTIEPVFDDLVVVFPDVSGMVTRTRVSVGQNVEPGTPLFEYVPDGQYSVLGYGSTTKPGAKAEPQPSTPEWYRTATEKRLARAAALRRWSTAIHAPRARPLTWERRLEQRLSARIGREDEMMVHQAGAAENERLGRHDANMVHVFDQALGMSRATEEGRPYQNDVAGSVYSLWVMRRLQFSGLAPVAEILRPGTAFEAFGLIPVLAGTRDLAGWSAAVVPLGEASPAAPLAVGTIELGTVPIEAADARLIFPDLAVKHTSLFVRVSLRDEPPREKLGKPVLITLASPLRPRLWFWLKG